MDNGRVWGVVVAVWLSLAAGDAGAQAPVVDDQSTGGGLAVGAALGAHAPVLGAELSYYAQLGTSLYLTPYLGLGYFRDTFNPAGGLMVVVGGRHRFLFDVGYGAAAWSGEASLEDGEIVEGDVTHTYYGVHVMAGYEFMARMGLFVRPSLGLAAYVGDTPGVGESITPTLNVTTGYKLW